MKKFSADDFTGRTAEHYEVARTFDSEFSTSDFIDRYLKNYPTREPGSILPADYAWNNKQKAKDDFPSFLEMIDHGRYFFIGLEEGQKKKRRNPTWSRDELILALDFYLKCRDSLPGKESDEILALSQEISTTGMALGLSGDADFRNPNGVYMKLMNFRRLDPEYSKDGKVGLKHGGKGDAEVWDEFSDDIDRLNHAANLIREITTDETNTNQYAYEPEIAEASEGLIVTVVHSRRERDDKLVKSKKAEFKKNHGRLYCEACGFDYEKTYGDRGRDYIECHHIIPVHTLEEGAKTKLKDLVLLCANCHRMVHAKSRWLTMDELVQLLSSH